MCSCSPESQSHPGLHRKKCGQQIVGGDSATLRCPHKSCVQQWSSQQKKDVDLLKLAHYPTKAKALAYTFQGVRPPTTDGSPGPCYCIHSSITRNGKYVALVTTAPPRLTNCFTNVHRHSPCPSSTRIRDLTKRQIPDPAVFPKVDKDIYKKRAPMYSITTKSSLGGDKTARPGPAGYCLGKAHQAPGTYSYFRTAALPLQTPLILAVRPAPHTCLWNVRLLHPAAPSSKPSEFASAFPTP
ncbi:PREDICTED: uncharacterized protein LOC104272700, partial [Apaloderma vittatum]|uniref:uncharacterized protein LOC104272700 n=1 Tax=Apaloderma vittatum TaxID=57397 RepID=UPI0005219013